MVDEFASFARIPKPVIEEDDIRNAVQDSVILFRESHPQVIYALHLPEAPLIASFDRRLLTQAVTNLVKNATEALEGFADAEAGWQARVDVHVRAEGNMAAIDVIDNGPGLPKHNRARLLEPYVTTKGHKGTGLGLAIVLKITEQHGGELELEDAPPGPGRTHGARVTITIPLKRPDAVQAPDSRGLSRAATTSARNA
jgi:two-component system nitrogen regulation sensor histidine kinase NtrY